VPRRWPARGRRQLRRPASRARWRVPLAPRRRHHAETGTPIVAPFDGVASVSRSFLGGLGVYVTGSMATCTTRTCPELGTLGDVETGDVIGYVGSTGHSSGPHDHFEWHPEKRKGGRPLRLPDARLRRPCDVAEPQARSLGRAATTPRSTRS
jgi:murein DD-endopeptidase MepM/ murein hydrolase activator NlpD